MEKSAERIILLVFLVPLVYLYVNWDNYSPIVSGVTHAGTNGFAGRDQFAVFTVISTLITLFIYFFLPLIYHTDKNAKAVLNQSRLNLIATGSAALLTTINIIVLYSGLHNTFILDPGIIFAIIGLGWCVLGSYMHELRPHSFISFNNQWTKKNEEVWRKTHLMAGKILFAGGILVFICCVFGSPVIRICAVTFVGVAITFVPYIYSMNLYYKLQRAYLNHH